MTIAMVLLLVIMTAIGFFAYRLTDVKQVNIARHLPFEADIQETVFIHMKNEVLKDIVISGEVKGANAGVAQPFIAILSFDYKKMGWKLVYNLALKNVPIPLITTARLLPGNLDQVIISYHQGSGGYLDYKILGWDENSVKVLLQRNAVFQGSFEVQGDQLIEKSGKGGTIFKWAGTTFVGTALTIGTVPPIAGTGPLELGDFSLAGLQLGDSVDKTKSILGQPVKEDWSGGEIFFSYDKVNVKFIKRSTSSPQLSLVAILTPQFATARGIKVGDSLDAVISKYGSTKRLDDQNGSGLAYYPYNRYFNMPPPAGRVLMFGVNESTKQVEAIILTLPGGFNI